MSPKRSTIFTRSGEGCFSCHIGVGEEISEVSSASGYIAQVVYSSLPGIGSYLDALACEEAGNSKVHIEPIKLVLILYKEKPP